MGCWFGVWLLHTLIWFLTSTERFGKVHVAKQVNTLIQQKVHLDETITRADNTGSLVIYKVVDLGSSVMEGDYVVLEGKKREGGNVERITIPQDTFIEARIAMQRGSR